MTALAPETPAVEPVEGRTQLEFDDNLLLPLLYGERDQHLDRIERQLGVSVVTRGNRIAISGPASATGTAQLALSQLYNRLKRGQEVDPPAVAAAIRLAAAELADKSSDLWREDAAFRTRKRRIAARSPGQTIYIKALRDKVDPYLRPIFDALNDMLPADQLAKRLGSGEIEVAPIAFMRGRTLSHAFVILDEAQNTTPVQMKMFLTRLGEASRMVVTGDPTQVDLPAGTRSGLAEALETLCDVDGISIVRFTDEDVVRHDLVARIVRAYEVREQVARTNKQL